MYLRWKVNDTFIGVTLITAIIILELNYVRISEFKGNDKRSAGLYVKN
jgi:hypothetical protein